MAREGKIYFGLPEEIQNKPGPNQTGSSKNPAER
jgi:hypothetical protein